MVEKSPVIIESSRLRVRISGPGTEYYGSRFDWTAFITQVTLDGKHDFCVDESLVPGQGTGGRGLCNEFGILEPVGYADCAVGGKFPKIGVGLLTRKSAGPYDFFSPYEIEPFSVSVNSGRDFAEFNVEPADIRGYAVSLKKVVTVSGNLLKIAYSLENRGSKNIATTEYCHNFIGVDGHNVGPDYRLEFPYTVLTEKASEILGIQGSCISWAGTPENDFYCIVQGGTEKSCHQWKLTHIPSGVGVMEMDDFKALRVALWGSKHVISPEAFIGINVGPGEKTVWSREYEFFC